MPWTRLEEYDKILWHKVTQSQPWVRGSIMRQASLSAFWVGPIATGSPAESNRIDPWWFILWVASWIGTSNQTRTDMEIIKEEGKGKEKEDINKRKHPKFFRPLTEYTLYAKTILSAFTPSIIKKKHKWVRFLW